jgi:hypothetical protein
MCILCESTRTLEEFVQHCKCWISTIYLVSIQSPSYYSSRHFPICQQMCEGIYIEPTRYNLVYGPKRARYCLCVWFLGTRTTSSHNELSLKNQSLKPSTPPKLNWLLGACIHVIAIVYTGWSNKRLIAMIFSWDLGVRIWCCAPFRLFRLLHKAKPPRRIKDIRSHLIQ